MSTFNGILTEYKNVSIDKFNGDNLSSTVFLLSHYHADHVEGLRDPQFDDYLTKNSHVLLYTSEITKLLIRNMCQNPNIDQHVVGLPVNDPRIISIPKEEGSLSEDVTLTLLPAAHSLGSVMFLIEGNCGRVLYTGDIRFKEGQIAKFAHLHNTMGQPKKIDSLYLDTTFCTPGGLELPDREECVSKVIELVRGWIERSMSHKVHLDCSASFGYEFLFIKLWETFNMKIHMSFSSRYDDIPKATQCITTWSNSTQIHACYMYRSPQKYISYSYPKGCAVLSNTDSSKLLTIRLCALSFTQFLRKTDVILEHKWSYSTRYKACFSTHSSLKELKNIVEYLNPSYIKPCAVSSTTSESEILDLLAPSRKPLVTNIGPNSHPSFTLHSYPKIPVSKVPGVVFEASNDSTRHSPDLIDLTSPAPPSSNDTTPSLEFVVPDVTEHHVPSFPITPDSSPQSLKEALSKLSEQNDSNDEDCVLLGEFMKNDTTPDFL